jgi:hypothetical protein
MDRAVDVALGGQMDESTNTMPVQQFMDQFGVANVASHEVMMRITRNLGKTGQIPSVGQLVQVNDAFGMSPKPAYDQVRANETRTACNQNRQPTSPN